MRVAVPVHVRRLFRRGGLVTSEALTAEEGYEGAGEI